MASFEQIMLQLKGKSVSPIYFLMGEEPFFIDEITNYITSNFLNEDEKEFNQTVLYGKDTEVMTVKSAAKRYPMMSNHQVVVVKEAQELGKIAELEDYVKNPQPTTVLVLNFKYKKLDKRTGLYKALKASKQTVIFESEKVRDYKMADWITQHVIDNGFRIPQKNASLLAEYLGTDLSKIANEIKKVSMLLSPGSEITADIIQQNIGISKEYNVFELQKAMGKKDVLLANKIVNYFIHNPKSAHITPVISSLFGFYSKLFKYHFLKDKNPQAVSRELKINPYFVREYQEAASLYDPKKLARIIEILRKYDVKSKGVENVSMTSGELMREMVYLILH